MLPMRLRVHKIDNFAHTGLCNLIAKHISLVNWTQ